MLAKPERETQAEAFINRAADVASNTQRSENVEVDGLGHRHCDLNITPDLIVSSIDELRRGEATQHQQQKTGKRDVPQFAPFARGGGKTVNDVSATVTRSPSCNRVVLASGFGRVAMIDLAEWRSGVSVVR